MEGPSRVLSRSSEDLHSFSIRVDEDDEDGVNLHVVESLADPPSSEDQSHSSSMPSLDWEDSRSDCLSEEMEIALNAALSSRTLTPLLKEELRCKIQLKRLQHGEEEITPDFSTKHFAMSMDEVVKKNKKMQQNRISAQKSRDRQKSLEKNIKSRLQLLEQENRVLEEQAQSLRLACRMARDWLQQHRSCLQHTNTPPASLKAFDTSTLSPSVLKPSLSTLFLPSSSGSGSSHQYSDAASPSVSSMVTRAVHSNSAHSTRSVISQI